MRDVDAFVIFTGTITWFLLLLAVWAAPFDFPFKLFLSALLEFVVCMISLIIAGGEFTRDYEIYAKEQKQKEKDRLEREERERKERVKS